jgi:hypothetical protein
LELRYGVKFLQVATYFKVHSIFFLWFCGFEMLASLGGSLQTTLVVFGFVHPKFHTVLWLWWRVVSFCNAIFCEDVIA